MHENFTICNTSIISSISVQLDSPQKPKYNPEVVTGLYRTVVPHLGGLFWSRFFAWLWEPIG